jgi:hypothetical protein
MTEPEDPRPNYEVIDHFMITEYTIKDCGKRFHAPHDLLRRNSLHRTIRLVSAC